ncbi:cytochrome P450 2J1 [Biomphalaria glabrata]|nr:cytochrome P450 2J1 [Biomphalaria glabrata]
MQATFFELPIVQFLLILLIIFLTIGLMSQKIRTKRKPDNSPPYPSPPSYFVGHLFQLTTNCRLKMREWRHATGDLYSLDFAGRHYIVVNGYKTFKEVFVHHAGSVQGVPPSFINDKLQEHNKGIAESNGENWLEQRKVSISILRSFGLGTNLLAERIQNEACVYLDELSKLRGAPLDARLLTTVSVSNIICSIIIGRRFEHQDPYFTELVSNMGKATKYFANLPLLTLFPWLYHIPGDLFNARKLVSIFKEINYSFSLANIERICLDDSSEKADNFIACYLSKMAKKHNEGKPTTMDKENLIAVIRNLFIAGTDTTSGNILWFLLYMLHYPDVQEKIYQEIVSRVGSERQITIEDKPNLPYLNAVVMETQRHACVTPFASPRVVIEEFTAEGFVFPAGAHILPNMDSVQHDPNVWENPGDFNPDRFLDKGGNLIQPEEFIPFSLGNRVCLGESMAKMELFLFFSAIIQRFQLLPEHENRLPPLDEIYGAIACPQPYKLRFIQRNI